MPGLASRLFDLFKKNEFDSSRYWESRYAKGGDSGSGSYGELAQFKADVINSFVKENGVKSVIEFGCGDGNQLSLASYSQYTGLDVSKAAIQNCIQKFYADKSKSFFLYDPKCFWDNGNFFASDLALSLDVIYHLVEQDVYERYLMHLFHSSVKYVIVYSSNVSIESSSSANHERHRMFTKDVEQLLAGKWILFDKIDNKFKPSTWSDENGSIADFFFYKKV